MNKLQLLDEYPVFVENVAKADTDCANADDAIACLRAQVEAKRGAALIGVFDHRGHVAALPEGKIAEEIIDSKHLLFCLSNDTPNPLIAAVCPRAVSVVELADKLSSSSASSRPWWRPRTRPAPGGSRRCARPELRRTRPRSLWGDMQEKRGRPRGASFCASESVYRRQVPCSANLVENAWSSRPRALSTHPGSRSGHPGEHAPVACHARPSSPGHEPKDVERLGEDREHIIGIRHEALLRGPKPVGDPQVFRDQPDTRQVIAARYQGGLRIANPGMRHVPDIAQIHEGIARPLLQQYVQRGIPVMRAQVAFPGLRLADLRISCYTSQDDQQVRWLTRRQGSAACQPGAETRIRTIVDETFSEDEEQPRGFAAACVHDRFTYYPIEAQQVRQAQGRKPENNRQTKGNKGVPIECALHPRRGGWRARHTASGGIAQRLPNP